MNLDLINSKRLCLVGIFSVILWTLSCRNKHDNNVSAVQREEWTCSMHPEIIRDHPGSCPICGMELVKKNINAAAITGIKLNDLIKPAGENVISSIQLTAISGKEVRPEIAALGSINYDTRLVNTITARISGRIEKLYVHYRYQHVMKGERIMDIYSPELLTAQQELLFLSRNDPENHSLINASKQKLLLLGMSESQILQVLQSKEPSLMTSVYSSYTGHLHDAGNSMPGEGNSGYMNSSTTEQLNLKEGMYVQKGQIMFQIFNTDKSWIVLNIYPEDQSVVKTGNRVKIVPETAPEKEFMAKIDFIEPFFREKNNTMTVRVYFDNASRNLPTGTQVKSVIYGDPVNASWLPRAAVISLGLSKAVFIKQTGGFVAHKIETGMVYEDLVQVLSGLSPADSVAANAQYLADSEGFIKMNHQP